MKVGWCCLAIAGWVAPLPAQSGLLNALDESGPVPLLGRVSPVSMDGLASAWIDPTWSPSATGMLFALDRTQFSDIRLWYLIAGLRWGPRWTLTVGATQFDDLFDTSLVNQDPSLASLAARATRGSLDAVIGKGALVGSVGMAYAADDNVGDKQNTTIASADLRLSPRRLPWVSLGLGESRAIGGSITGTPGGRTRVDLTLAHTFSNSVEARVSAAVLSGALWKYSETREAYGLTALLSAFRVVDVGFATEHYTTTFGLPSAGWSTTVIGGLRVGGVRFGVRYKSTVLGAGSGYGFSLSFEPRTD